MNHPLTPNLADQNDRSPVFAVAAGLVYLRTGNEEYQSKVITALENLPGTEFGERAVDFLSRTGGLEDDNFHPVNYWVPWLIDSVYGSDYAIRERTYCRAFGYTEWLAPTFPQAGMNSE